MKRNQFTFSMGTFLFMLVAGTGYGQQTPATPETQKPAMQNPAIQNNTYETWDADANDMIDDNEFYDGVMNSNSMSMWDADEDGSLSDTEIYDGSRSMWDANADGMLNETEWNDGITTYYSDYDSDSYGEFMDWDSNQDGMIDGMEYNDGIGRSGFYRNWDANNDSSVDPREFSQGIYRSYDADGSGYIEAGEYDKYQNTKKARPDKPGDLNDY
jgi:hypothetical protein